MRHYSTTAQNNSTDKGTVIEAELVRPEAVTQQFDQAFNLVLAAEQGGERPLEDARDAIKIFETLLAEQRHHLSSEEVASCYDGIGACHIVRNDLDAANTALNEGLKADPEHAPLWYHLGEVLQLRGQHMTCIAMLSKFIELSKTYYHSSTSTYDVAAQAVQTRLARRSRAVDTVHLLCGALFRRSVAYIRIKEETMALADLWLIVDTAHSSEWQARAYAALAQLARLRGTWHQGCTLASKAIDAAARAAPSRDRAQVLAQAHHVRAVCYEALDDEARADEDHVRADYYHRESVFRGNTAK